VKPEISVPAERNGCVAFANAVPHRLRALANLTDVPQTRTFLNVFVIDPEQPLEAPPTVATAAELAAVLVQCFARLINRTLPRDVALLIAERTRPGLWRDAAHARQFRAAARKAMQATKTSLGGFAHYHYGNCGMQSFVDPADLERLTLSREKNFRGRALNHSSSGSASDTAAAEWPK
jgi:hypothetical protein